MAFRLDRTTLNPPTRRADGSVVYEGALTRAGVFEYRNADGSIRREWRPPAEVGRADSLATLELAHVCDDHPAERGQAKAKSVGAVAGPRFDGRLVTGKVMVREDAVNAKVALGKCELSCGYDVKLVEAPGITPDGERYDAIQTDIVYEHVAIVAKGRAGSEVRLRLDALEVETRDDGEVDIDCWPRVVVTISSAALSCVALEEAVRSAVRSMPGVTISVEDRADAAPAVKAGWVSPDGQASVRVSTRDISLNDLTAQLKAALKNVDVTVGGVAKFDPMTGLPLRGDAAITAPEDKAMKTKCDTCGAPLKDGKYAADHLDHADQADKIKTLEAQLAAEKARADKAEGERDAANDKAKAADKARQDAIDAGPALARARVKLEDQVKAVVGADFKVDGVGDHDLRLAALDKLGAQLDAGKRGNVDYVGARFDAALELRTAAGQHVDAARGAGASGGQGGQPPMTEAAAMAEARRRADARGRSNPTGASA